jgi:predicted RNase H-like HicB family nuclease
VIGDNGAKRTSRASPGDQLMSRYLVISEESANGYSAFLPDTLGCIAAGSTREEVEVLMREGVAFHFEGLRKSGDPVPSPRSTAAYVDVVA